MKNTYFENMYKIGCRYQAKKTAAKKKADAYYEKEQWDQVHAYLKDFRESNPFPFSDGAVMALEAWRRSNRHGSDAFEVERLPWPEDMKDFADTLKYAGVKRIVVTSQSTALMRGIYGLYENGWTLVGPQIVTTELEHSFGSSDPDKEKGIAFEMQE